MQDARIELFFKIGPFHGEYVLKINLFLENYV